MLILKYSLLPGLERTGVLAPVVPVTFIHGNFEFPTFALVDSGGEQGLISTVIADALNINWQKLPRHVGLTTSGNFVYHTFPNLVAKIDDYEFRLSINIAEGVNAFKCILGRKDIFQQAKITFEGYKKEFRIDFRNLN
ncbi:hypothetical protein HYW55_00085 [Candidatus Gottesmanbacteria bacterium]|nr:hypothetical protein [Candidatus Gottesmanbacteria bacterium]